jgi:hypothetical protein
MNKNKVELNYENEISLLQDQFSKLIDKSVPFIPSENTSLLNLNKKIVTFFSLKVVT